MDENDKPIKNDSSCPFGASLTGITTDFFTYYTDDIVPLPSYRIKASIYPGNT